MIDPGVVGSPADLATLVVCVVGFVRVRESQGQGHAATVALAEWTDRVREVLDEELPRLDPDRVRADLDVPERESQQYLADGGEPVDE